MLRAYVALHLNDEGTDEAGTSRNLTKGRKVSLGDWVVGAQGKVEGTKRLE